MKTLYQNGTIITVNDHQPVAEALITENGKILEVGDLDTVKVFKDDNTVVVDLKGHTMLPGFIDGHSHIGSILAFLPKLFPPPVGRIDTKDALLAELRHLIENGGCLENGWLVAEGYENSLFENNAHPTKAELDSVSTDVPMLILHSSGHVGVINSKALELSGWNKDTPNPPGGVIDRDPVTGEPTGFLEEKTIHALAFAHVLNGLSQDYLLKMFIDTQRYYASFGITTAQDGGTLMDFLPMLKLCQEKDLLMLDIVSYIYQEFNPDLIPSQSAKVRYDRHFKIAGAKLVNDGSPQGKTAWLTQPYYVKPDNKEEGYRGYPIFTDEQVFQYCKQAIAQECQVLVHCNGDAAADQFMAAYKKAKETLKSTSDLRPVIIHAQTLREDQLDTMKELGMMPSYFNDHVYYWGDYYLDSILGPERSHTISPMQPTVQRGMRFTLHNDFPVTPPDILFDIHNAVNRKTRNGKILGYENAVDVMEAIKAVTIYGAYQHFDESIKGSLEVGKLADFVILDKNPLDVPKENLKDIKVLQTIKEDKIIYSADPQ